MASKYLYPSLIFKISVFFSSALQTSIILLSTPEHQFMPIDAEKRALNLLSKSTPVMNFFLLFCDRVSLPSPGCPGTHHIDQAGSHATGVALSPAPVSQVLGLKVGTTIPGSPITSLTVGVNPPHAWRTPSRVPRWRQKSV